MRAQVRRQFQELVGNVLDQFETFDGELQRHAKKDLDRDSELTLEHLRAESRRISTSIANWSRKTSLHIDGIKEEKETEMKDQLYEQILAGVKPIKESYGDPSLYKAVNVIDQELKKYMKFKDPNYSLWAAWEDLIMDAFDDKKVDNFKDLEIAGFPMANLIETGKKLLKHVKQ